MKKSNRKPKRTLSTGILRKYLSIIVPVVLMLLLITAIAAFNYFSSSLQSSTTTDINLAARQSELSQSIAKDVMALHLAVVTPQAGYNENTLEESLFLTNRTLEQSIKIFDQTLTAFLNGGEVINVDGSNISIEPINMPEATYGLERGLRMWVPFRQLIESFIQSAREGNIDEEAVTFASDYARLFEGRLFNEMTDLNNLLTAKADRQARTAQIVNGIGLLLAFILFFYIVLVAVRRLIRTDAELADARKETTAMMDTIQEGLFLIDDKLQIGSQQSSELKHILPIEDISGLALDEVLGNMISENDIVNTRRFIKQLFNKRVKETLLDDLNPLRQVRVAITNDENLMDARYLRFKFNRVYENKKIAHVLVTVSDITDSVRLQNQLERERQQNKEQTEMLIKVLHLDQDLLAGFVRRTTQITQQVNTMLKSSSNTQAGLRKKLNDIFREVHSFKGDASALEFDSFVDIAEQAEDKLKQLRNRDQLSGDDFIGVTIILDRLINLNEEISKIQGRLANFSQRKSDTKESGKEPSFVSNMEQYAKQIASRQNKQVNLTIVGDQELPELPQETEDRLHEIITQLLRNAIVHGIEDPEQRASKNKDEAGHITIGFKHGSDNRIELSVHDDGAGINCDALREKLRRDPRYSDQNVSDMPEKQLYKALFLPGLSTAKSQTEDGGRGEGMSIILDRVKQLPDGKIGIQSIAERMTRFVVSFAMP